MLDSARLAVGDDNIGLVVDNGLYQVRNAILRVLVVAVGIDNDDRPRPWLRV
jgi:hypothetical protein